MRVSELGSSRAAAPARRKKATPGKGGAFAVRLREVTGMVEAAGGIESPPVHAVESILAIQEVSDAAEERSRGSASRYGDTVLDGLGKLRHDLLMGAVGKDKLAGLAQTMCAQRRASADPGLNEIKGEIELRAAVEIAKFTRTV